jgi:hypothetical protein
LRTSPVVPSSSAAETERACTSRPMNVDSLIAAPPRNCGSATAGAMATREYLRGGAPFRYIRSSAGRTRSGTRWRRARPPLSPPSPLRPVARHIQSGR